MITALVLGGVLGTEKTYQRRLPAWNQYGMYQYRAYTAIDYAKPACQPLLPMENQDQSSQTGQELCSVLVSLINGCLQPAHSLVNILRNAVTFEVTYTEVVL